MSFVDGNTQLVFFDLETSGLGNNADVLQIAMQTDCSEFNEYVKPTKDIPPFVSQINNLTVRDGELYHNSTEKLSTLPRRLVLERLLQYLRQFEYPCVLVAHNCPFDSSHLMRMIRNEDLENEFGGVIDGFTDTLNMLRRKFPERRFRGQLKLTTLAAELSLSTEGAHDANYDVYLLQAIALHHFTTEQLVENRTSFLDVLKGHVEAEKTALFKETLAPMRCFLTGAIITRIAAAGISYEKLNDVYRREGFVGAKELLQGKVNGIPQLIYSKSILYSILSHLNYQNSDLKERDSSVNYRHL